MISESVAQRLSIAAAADAALASELREAYRGRHDVLDALWWRCHPLTESPAGRPDPAAALPPLQAQVYSRTRPDSPTGDDEQRLRALTDRLRQDATALDDVLLLFRDEPVLRRGGPTGVGPTGGTPALPVEENAPADLGPATRRHPGAPGGPGLRRALLLLAIGAAVGAITVGAVSTLGQPDGSSTRPADEAEASASPGLVQLFNEPPIPDQTTIDLGPEFRRDSIHAVFVERETNSFVFVARRGDDLYCVILRAQGQQGASACVGLAELARRGMNLTATLPVNPFTLGKDSLVQGGDLADVTIRVSTDGNVTSETAPHPTSCGGVGDAARRCR